MGAMLRSCDFGGENVVVQQTVFLCGQQRLMGCCLVVILKCYLIECYGYSKATGLLA